MQDAPTVQLDAADLQNGGMDLISLLVKGGMVPSRSEGRRAIEQGGVTVDGEKVTDVRKAYTQEELTAGVLIRRGKKTFKKFVL